MEYILTEDTLHIKDSYLVESEEIDEVISLFNSLSIEQQENAITYMKFLKNQ